MEKALSMAHESLGAIQEKSGARAILGLVSGQCSNEEMSAFKAFMGTAFEGSGMDALDGRHSRNRMALNGEPDTFFLGKAGIHDPTGRPGAGRGG